LLAAPVTPAIVVAQVRQNYHPDCETAVNTQIQLQLYTSYVYLSMAFYFDRDDVALGNFARFFLHQSHEWTARTEKLLRMQNRRGGRIFLSRITKPERNEWLGGLQAMECAFHLEMTITENLLELHQMATNKSDPQLCDFLRCHCLCQQMETLEELAGYLNDLRKMWALGEDLTEYLFDRLTLGDRNMN
jgi:ferritin